jgi:hypothetical protein
MAQEFTISAESMPTKSYSVTFREPLFKDRREASRRYPGQQAGYSMEELLLATCITGINNQPFPPIPRDPIQNYKELPLVDGQYLLAVFLGMFTLDQELSDQAKELGTKFKLTPSFNNCVNKEDMPLKEFSVSFRPAQAYDRIENDRRYPGANSNCGYSLEEMLFADCITAVDGEPISNKPKDVISLIDDWKHIDAQFAIAVFINTVTIDENDTKQAKSLGKSLRAGIISSPKTTSDNKRKSTTTQA